MKTAPDAGGFTQVSRHFLCVPFSSRRLHSCSAKSFLFSELINCTALSIGGVKRISADGSASPCSTCQWKRARCQIEMARRQCGLLGVASG